MFLTTLRPLLYIYYTLLYYRLADFYISLHVLVNFFRMKKMRDLEEIEKRERTERTVDDTMEKDTERDRTESERKITLRKPSRKLIDRKVQ